MPLKLNVGLARKVGEANYSSRGASVNVEVEVDSSLAADPGKLQERIRQLYTLVRASLTEELNGHNGNGHAPAPKLQNQEPPPGANGGSGNGHANGRNDQRPATQSQVKAIYAIARNQRIDLTQFLRDRFQVVRPELLGIKEASTVIDDLKSTASQSGG